jgi:RNA polymerase sigma-70 factor (ECF subfamily)
LAQDTFVRVQAGLEGLRARESPRSWIIRTAANVFKNELRRRGTGMRSATEISLDAPMSGGEEGEPRQREVEDPEAPDPWEERRQSERVEVVRQEIQALPPKMRSCLLLHEFQGLAYKEVARVMKISIETVKSHIFQGRRKLEERLKQRWERGDL